MDDVYFLTTVLNGHVGMTSILAPSVHAAKVQAHDVFIIVMPSHSAWTVEEFYSLDGVTVWQSKDFEFKATLIKA